MQALTHPPCSAIHREIFSVIRNFSRNWPMRRRKSANFPRCSRNTWIAMRYPKHSKVKMRPQLMSSANILKKIGIITCSFVTGCFFCVCSRLFLSLFPYYSTTALSFVSDMGVHVLLITYDTTKLRLFFIFQSPLSSLLS